MPVLYLNAGANGYSNNQGATADPVNSPPLIYEPPAALTNSVAQVWVGASGGSGGVNDPNWGGAAFWKLDRINPFADRGDFRGETLRLNGGYTNMAARLQWRAVWRRALGI